MASHHKTPPETPQREKPEDSHQGIKESAEERAMNPPPSVIARRSRSSRSTVQASSSQEQLGSELQGDTQDGKPIADEDAEAREDQQGPLDLESFDWDELEKHWYDTLEAGTAKEAALYEKFEDWAEVFNIWSRTSAQKDNSQARKRLKTKFAYVQLSERELEEKKQHYEQVVNAFRSALALLSKTSIGSPRR